MWLFNHLILTQNGEMGFVHAPIANARTNRTCLYLEWDFLVRLQFWLIHCWWIGPAERERERERERESGGRSNNVASDWQVDHATHSTRAATVENVIRGEELKYRREDRGSFESRNVLGCDMLCIAIDTSSYPCVCT